jgi:hypothetical protein
MFYIAYSSNWCYNLINMEKPKKENKKCPSCDKDISIKAKVCPYCRHKLQNWFKRHPILTVLITSPLWIAFISGFSQGLNNTPSKERGSKTSIKQQETFVASVNFTGTQFVISNLDPKTCENAQMRVNSDYKLDGYELESALDSVVKSGEAIVYKVGTGQFTKSDGTRFNSFTTKPQNFYIGCRGNNELNGAYWYGSF